MGEDKGMTFDLCWSSRRLIWISSGLQLILLFCLSSFFFFFALGNIALQLHRGKPSQLHPEVGQTPCLLLTLHCRLSVKLETSFILLTSCLLMVQIDSSSCCSSCSHWATSHGPRWEKKAHKTRFNFLGHASKRIVTDTLSVRVRVTVSVSSLLIPLYNVQFLSLPGSVLRAAAVNIERRSC